MNAPLMQHEETAWIFQIAQDLLRQRKEDFRKRGQTLTDAEGTVYHAGAVHAMRELVATLSLHNKITRR